MSTINLTYIGLPEDKQRLTERYGIEDDFHLYAYIDDSIVQTLLKEDYEPEFHSTAENSFFIDNERFRTLVIHNRLKVYSVSENDQHCFGYAGIPRDLRAN